MSCDTNIFYLTLSEIKDLLEEHNTEDVQHLIDTRKTAYERYEHMTPPRVMTSEGEIIFGEEQENVPEGTLVGSPVSPGVVEGYAKVVKDPIQATLSDSEILIAPFTDPGWTPLFQQAKGLVLEVGGIMTHGTVVAREYGIPAVAGIEKATEQIQDGQWIRIDGSDGYVTILSQTP